MATQKKKRIMRDFVLDEISAVTVPAQKGARMLIMKRADEPAVKNGIKHLPLYEATGGGAEKLDISKLSAEEIGALVLKGRMRMTTPANGHSHLIDVDELAMARGGGTTNYCGEGDVYHGHPFVVTKGGDITIGYAMGHSHDVMSIEAVKAAASPARVESTTEKGNEMDEKEVKKLRALADMNDAQKAYFGKLDDAGQESFIGMPADQRSAAVGEALAKAAAADPVAYTAKDGTVYRKSDGEAAVKLAKTVDGLFASVETSVAYVKDATEASRHAEAERLAASWDHIGLPQEEKLALAKATVALPEALRKAQIDTIAKGRELMAPLFKSFGAKDGGTNVGGDPAARLDTLAKARAKDTGEAYSKAYIEVCRTPEGQALYQETKPAMH